MKIILYAAFLLSILLFGCSKQPDVLFEVPFQLTFEIPAGLNPFDKHFILVRNVPTNIEALKRQFEVAEGGELVIRPASAILTSLGQSLDFDFLQEVELSVFDTDPDDDRIAFLTEDVPFNAGRNVVVLPFDTDLSDYLEQDRVNFKVSLRLRTTTPSFIDSVMEVQFTVE